MIPLGILAAANSRGALRTIADEIISDGPWAYWPLSDPPNSSFAEDMVGIRSLSAVGLPSFGSSQLVSGWPSVHLNGSNQYLASVANQLSTDIATAFNGDKAFTLEAILRPDGNNGRIIHVGHFNISGSQGLWLLLGANGIVSVGAFNGSFTALEASNDPLQIGEIYHVVGTRAAGGESKLYINGYEVASGNIPGSLRAGSTTTSGGPRASVGVSFGGAGAANSGFLAGLIGHCAVYAKVLTPERVLVHAHASGVA